MIARRPLTRLLYFVTQGQRDRLAKELVVGQLQVDARPRRSASDGTGQHEAPTKTAENLFHHASLLGIVGGEPGGGMKPWAAFARGLWRGAGGVGAMGGLNVRV